MTLQTNRRYFQRRQLCVLVLFECDIPRHYTAPAATPHPPKKLIKTHIYSRESQFDLQLIDLMKSDRHFYGQRNVTCGCSAGSEHIKMLSVPPLVCVVINLFFLSGFYSQIHLARLFHVSWTGCHRLR